MAGRHGTGVSRPGAWIRRLPIISLAAFVGMDLAMVWIYESTLAWSQGCFAPGVGGACTGVGLLWLPLTALWGVSAVGIAVLMGAQALLTRKGRTLGTPNGLLVTLGIAVSVLGLLSLNSAAWTGYPDTSGSATFGLHIAYVTSAPLLFAVTFVDFDPDQLPTRKWAAALAVVNEVVALTAGLWSLR